MQESGEMYLETILILSQKMDKVRAINVAESMGFSKPSVSRALTRLKNDFCITLDDSNGIKLTPKGKCIADKIYERHVVISELLMALGVDKETALMDACKIEHDISDATFQALKDHSHSIVETGFGERS